MNNYYRRSGTPVSRSNRVVENDNRKIKKLYKFLIAFTVSFLAGVVAMLGFDYTLVVVPAIVGIVLLFGSVERNSNFFSFIIPITTVLPIVCGLGTGSSPARIILDMAILNVGMILAINYRPFLWKKTVLLGDLPLWYFILFGSVTNNVTGTVLLVLITLKALIATVITLGIVFVIRVLLTGEEIYKWTEQS